MDIRQVDIGGRMCRLYSCGVPRALLVQVVSPMQMAEQDAAVERIAAAGVPFALVAVPIADWEQELMPWPEAAVSRRPEVGGGAGETLRYIVDSLLGPQASPGAQASRLQTLGAQPSRLQMGAQPSRLHAGETPAHPEAGGTPAYPEAGGTPAHPALPVILGGYSLGGLFSLWAACQSDRFAAVAAGSPSLWAGDWPQYAATHPMQARRVYLSLGDREERSRNKTMARVGDRIRAEYSRLQQQLGPENTTLVWEQGGHFADPAARMARAFVWCLKQLDR